MMALLIVGVLAQLGATFSHASFDEAISEAQSHLEGGRCVGPSRDGRGNDFHLWDNPAITGWHCFCRSLPFNGKQCNAFPSRQDPSEVGSDGNPKPPDPPNIPSPAEPSGPSGDPVAIIDPISMPESAMGRGNEDGALDSVAKARDLFSANAAAATAFNRTGDGVNSKAAAKAPASTPPSAAIAQNLTVDPDGAGSSTGTGAPQALISDGSGPTGGPTATGGAGSGATTSDVASSGDAALAASKQSNGTKTEFELAAELNGPNGPGQDLNGSSGAGGAGDMTLGSGDSAAARLSEAEAEEEFMRGRRPSLFEIVNYRYGRLTKRLND